MQLTVSRYLVDCQHTTDPTRSESFTRDTMHEAEASVRRMLRNDRCRAFRFTITPLSYDGRGWVPVTEQVFGCLPTGR